MKIKLMLILPLAAVLIAALILGTNAARSQVQAAPPLPGAGLTEDDWHTCKITEVAVFPDRIHVSCSEYYVDDTSDVYYFAAPADSQHALTTNRLLTLLNSAYALGNGVYLNLDPDETANPPGCETYDCRLLKGVILSGNLAP
jgi:hypothetical protein